MSFVICDTPARVISSRIIVACVNYAVIHTLCSERSMGGENNCFPSEDVQFVVMTDESHLLPSLQCQAGPKSTTATLKGLNKRVVEHLRPHFSIM